MKITQTFFRDVFIIGLGVILLLMVIGLARADELEDLQNDRQQITTGMIQLQAQGQLIASQLQDYILQYARLKTQISDNLEKLRLKREAIDKQTQALIDQKAKELQTPKDE